jgi:RIO kinase 2
MGSKNHELVPTPLIEKISHLRGGAGSVHRSISNLAKIGLIARVKEAKYDGYRLTYGGLDYLALHTHASRRNVYSVGDRIGVGKESDIMVVADEHGVQRVLKIHRLGRISFRTVKANRDYLRNRQSGSWMYLSRLAAMKEFSFMKALREEGFPVPEPLAQSRHTIVMELINAHPLRQISAVPDPASLYADLIALIMRLAKHGLIHGDFNEFNILAKEEEADTLYGPSAPAASTEVSTTAAHVKVTPVIIDFPQMISMDHSNAELYFDRDVECVKSFFRRRFQFTSDEPGPFYAQARKTIGKGGAKRLDAAAEASGFTKKMAKDLEAAIRESTLKNEGHERSGSGDDEAEYDSEDWEFDAVGEQVEVANGADDSPSPLADPSALDVQLGASASSQAAQMRLGSMTRLAINDQT